MTEGQTESELLGSRVSFFTNNREPYNAEKETDNFCKQFEEIRRWRN